MRIWELSKTMNTNETAPAVGSSEWFEHETSTCEKTGIRTIVYSSVPKYKGQLPDPYATESGPPIPEIEDVVQTEPPGCCAKHRRDLSFCINCGGDGATSYDFSPNEDGVVICSECHGSGRGSDILIQGIFI